MSNRWAGPLPANSEMVLHDLSLLPTSILAVHGRVTGRKPEDPATEMLLKAAAFGGIQTMVGYETQLRDGGAGSSPPPW